MKTAVIIPTYNRAATLGPAIRSALRQAPETALEVLVVDDGSTDETPDLLAALCHQHGNLRHVRQENAGVAAARNAGLRALSDATEVVTFLDSDDLLPEGRLAQDLPRLVANPALDLTYGRMMLTDALDYTRLAPAHGARTAEIVGIHLSCALFRRPLITRIGSFDESFRQAEDTDYLLRIFESGSRFRQTDTLCLYYFQHPGGITRQTAEARRCFVQALHKSLLRRRANPGLRLHKPDFGMTPLREQGAF